jgi:hypothetical protein
MIFPLWAAAPDTVDQAAARFDLTLAKLSAPLRLKFRAIAAKALQPHHPALAQRFSDPVRSKNSICLNSIRMRDCYLVRRRWV